MFKRNKTYTLLFFIALMSGISGFAQTAAQQQEQTQKIEVNSSELQEFATVYKQVMETHRKNQQEMVSIIKEEGLTVSRYRELKTAENNPQANLNISDIELKKKEHIDSKFQKMAPEFQKEQTLVIKKSNLSLDRYQQIAMAISRDQSLQEEFQKILIDIFDLD